MSGPSTNQSQLGGTTVDTAYPSSQGAGAEATDTLGSSFGAVYDFVRNEQRVVEQLSNRVPDRQGNNRNGYGESRGPYRQNGTPMIITTEAMALQGRYLIFWSGPSNTQWSFPMRGAQQQTRSGTIYHSWKDGSRQTYFDEPSVSFTFQAGNIMPVRTSSTNTNFTSDVVSLPPGLLDFYDFFEILDQPKILSDGRPNFVLIAYHSLIYPEIFMRGFFNPEGLQFSEDAQNPANLTWTSTFKIRSTEPNFWNKEQLLSAWLSASTPALVEGQANAAPLAGSRFAPVSIVEDQISSSRSLAGRAIVPGQEDPSSA